MVSDNNSIYAAIGAEKLRELVEAFYPKVLQNPVIGPLFANDIQPIIEKQLLFLTQFLGGPSLYSDKYGHPMMRARHMPFTITPGHAEAWLKCMREALEEIQLDKELQHAILDRLKGTAFHFVNSP